MKNKVVADEIDDNVKQCIGTATSQVPESLLIDPAREGLVEKVDNVEDDISGGQ